MPDILSKTVVIGGGTGCPNVLRGLRKLTPNLTAIVTMFDNGGSTGRLRTELGVPALGDLRRALGALAMPTEPQASLARLLEYRFPPQTSLAGHSIGNLFLAGLLAQEQSLESAVGLAGRLLGVQGQVLPVSLGHAHLCAELRDGTQLRGEEVIDQLDSGSPPIERVFLEPSVEANPRATEALLQADLIVLGPGDLYTSLLPNLLVEGLAKAVHTSSAMKVFVGNIVNRPGQTQGFNASTFLREVIRYLGISGSVDCAVFNDPSVVGRDAVPVDEDACSPMAKRIVVAPFTAHDGRSHDPDLLAHALMELVNQKQST